MQKGRATRDTQPETRPRVLLREEAAETIRGGGRGFSLSCTLSGAARLRALPGTVLRSSAHPVATATPGGRTD